MKTILTILFCLVLFSSKAQDTESSIYHLQKAERVHYGTSVCAVGGGVFLAFALNQSNSAGGKNTGLYVISGMFFTAAIAIDFSAWHHVGLAGKKLYSKKVALSVSPTNASLCYKF